MGEALAANVLLRSRDAQIGDGLHGLSMEYSCEYSGRNEAAIRATCKVPLVNRG